MSEILTIEQMLPPKFCPISVRHFLCEIDGIDSFLVKSVKLADFRPRSWPGTESQEARGYMSVTLHDVTAPSTMQQVHGWMKAAGQAKELMDAGKSALMTKKEVESAFRTVHIKRLDPIGNVIQLWHFYDVQLGEVHFQRLDYTDPGISEIVLELSFGGEKLEY